MLLAKPAVQLAVVLLYLHGVEWKPGTLGLHGKVLVTGDCRGGFCVKTPEAAPMLNRASSSQL